MPVPWKLIGVAGLAGVAATGVVVARRRREQAAVDPAELRERLHRRLAEVEGGGGAAGGSAATGSGPAGGGAAGGGGPAASNPS